MQDYRKLGFWQRAHAQAIALDRLTLRFRRTGHTDLRRQLNAAAKSVAATVVEGCGASSKPESARYLDIAVKSANETEYHLQTARDLDLLSRETWQKHVDELIAIRKMIFTYRKRILESLNDDKGPTSDV